MPVALHSMGPLEPCPCKARGMAPAKPDTTGKRSYAIPK
jgi:hypothetical protein